MIILCAVCFQGADALMRDSLNGGIAVLLGVTGLVLAGFASFFVRLARRGRTAGGADGEPFLGEALGPAAPRESFGP